ncbi:MAG TPA: hypothetical protein PK323_11730 [Bacteroidia bacterium]|nr:hypothetical protein [Bacteroidia bacterium]
MRRILFIFVLFTCCLQLNSSKAQELEAKKHPFFINASQSYALNNYFFESPSFSTALGIVKKENNYLGINFSRYNSKGAANLNTFYYDARIGTHDPSYIGFHKTINTSLKFRCISAGLFYARLHQFISCKAIFYTSINLMTVFPVPFIDISSRDYFIVSSKRCLDFLIKFTLISKRKKRTNLSISPTFRYNYIPNISVSVYDNPWDSVSKINSYKKHMILFGLSFEFMNFYKKQKVSITK